MSNDTVYKRFIVSGRVQGVFFRASTAREAGRLGLSGTAKNLSDGTVVVMAAGTKKNLEVLEQWLVDGPPMARVTEVVAQDVDMAGWPGGDGFCIS